MVGSIFAGWWPQIVAPKLFFHLGFQFADIEQSIDHDRLAAEMSSGLAGEALALGKNLQPVFLHAREPKVPTLRPARVSRC
jgi:hypothetical protein